MSGCQRRAEWDAGVLECYVDAFNQAQAKVEDLQGQLAGMAVELDDQRAITRSTFFDLNHTLDAIRDALTHIDAGEFGIARRALQAVLEEVPR